VAQPDGIRFPVNGVDGDTGEYLLRPLEAGAAAALARDESGDPALVGWLKEVAAHQEQPRLGLPAGIEPTDVGQAGWGIVFHEAETEEVRSALRPLVEHRRATIGDRVKTLEYRTGDEWRPWLARHGVAPATVDPRKLPYYLLLVGEPTLIPYRFQYLLDAEYAVGRVAFREAAEYAAYARSVREYETSGQPSHARTAVFFGTRHDGDRATELSADELVRPLAEGQAGEPSAAEEAGWGTKLLWGSQATRAGLETVLRGDERGRPYGLCFTATHGVGFRPTDRRQLDRQGALLCQDWSGPGRIRETDYLSAADVPADARVHGLIAFHFACYAAGTPERDDFLPDASGVPKKIAERPFVARLPQALLSHPGGGALAVIGHVERAWGCSFLPDGGQPQLQPFRNALAYILAEQPVGHCLKDLRALYTGLSTGLADALGEIRHGATYDDAALAVMWLARNDARNYTLVGDPAVRLDG
jgi:hypothetical protein